MMVLQSETQRGPRGASTDLPDAGSAAPPFAMPRMPRIPPAKFDAISDCTEYENIVTAIELKPIVPDLH